MSYTLVLEWMPGDLYMSAVTARCTAPTSSYSVVWLPPNKVYQITLYCGSTSLVSFLVGAFRGKAWSYMIRKIIHIDEEKCNGCGACAAACHEGAIGMVGGKAKLLRDDYCDGLGDCLPACPTGAITFVEREAAAYDEAAVLKNKQEAEIRHAGCPGQQMRRFNRDQSSSADTVPAAGVSQLRQWPCQIKLLPVNAPYLNGAKLLIAADCTAYAYARLHEDFMKGKITMIGCPKLDDEDYSAKLTQIIAHNDIESVTIVRMEVPCCGGLEFAAKKALQTSGKLIPWQVITISVDGKILS